MRGKGKQAVYLVVTPQDWRPQRPWDVPPAIVSAELYAKNLPVNQAVGFARVFNKAQLAKRSQDRKWAIIARYIRPKYRPSRAKGGAA